MKAKITIGIILISVVIFSACSSLKVTVKSDNTVDFSKFTTFGYYGWAAESDKILTPFDKKLIESAFGEELTNRGLKHVKNGGDIIITIFIVTQEKTEITANPSMGMSGYGGYYGFGPRYAWGPGYRMGYTTTTTYRQSNYTVGTLIIDIYDSKKEQLIWESVGTKTLSSDTKNKEQRIKQVAARMMSKYPVEPSNEK